MVAHFWWGSVFLVGVPVIVALLIAAVMGALFTRRQARVPGPLLEVSLLRDRTFRAALLLLFLGLAAMNGVQYLAPQYLRLVMDVPPLTAGLWLVPLPWP
ncbi:hypothetical protein ACFW31_09755 [Nocardiopsis alba]|uniref:hypothetical protein n=1 Tax=Nocardiopsis alba TaxID=53437 RepID=UPI003671BFFA